MVNTRDQSDCGDHFLIIWHDNGRGAFGGMTGPVEAALVQVFPEEAMLQTTDVGRFKFWVLSHRLFGEHEASVWLKEIAPSDHNLIHLVTSLKISGIERHFKHLQAGENHPKSFRKPFNTISLLLAYRWPVWAKEDLLHPTGLRGSGGGVCGS